MAVSRFPTHQYSSTHLTESCGTILFNSPLITSSSKVCVIRNLPTNECLLPKGRRNINESRKEAALRETWEETGYAGRLLEVDLKGRCTRGGDGNGGGDRNGLVGDDGDGGADLQDEDDERDEVRLFKGVEGEPFHLQVRELGGGRVKLIWWFLAVLAVGDGEEGRGPGEEEKGIVSEWVDVRDAVERVLTFEGDREVVRAAVEIVRASGRV